MVQLRKVSVTPACDFFTVPLVLATSFLATTIAYWVVLIQSTNF